MIVFLFTHVYACISLCGYVHMTEALDPLGSGATDSCEPLNMCSTSNKSLTDELCDPVSLNFLTEGEKEPSSLSQYHFDIPSVYAFD